jgi:hypothetical protein
MEDPQALAVRTSSLDVAFVVMKALGRHTLLQRRADDMVSFATTGTDWMPFRLSSDRERWFSRLRARIYGAVLAKVGMGAPVFASRAISR